MRATCASARASDCGRVCLLRGGNVECNATCIQCELKARTSACLQIMIIGIGKTFLMDSHDVTESNVRRPRRPSRRSQQGHRPPAPRNAQRARSVHALASDATQCLFARTRRWPCLPTSVGERSRTRPYAFGAALRLSDASCRKPSPRACDNARRPSHRLIAPLNGRHAPEHAQERCAVTEYGIPLNLNVTEAVLLTFRPLRNNHNR